jgi:hypothetical protein
MRELQRLMRELPRFAVKISFVYISFRQMAGSGMKNETKSIATRGGSIVGIDALHHAGSKSTARDLSLVGSPTWALPPGVEPG